MISFTHAERTGFIPHFFSAHDLRPAKEQLHTAYAHGGGFQPFKGFTLKYDAANPLESTISYPGDPVFRAIAWGKLREEVIIVFDHAWVFIVQPDGTYEATRCD